MTALLANSKACATAVLRPLDAHPPEGRLVGAPLLQLEVVAVGASGGVSERCLSKIDSTGSKISWSPTALSLEGGGHSECCFSDCQ